MTFTEAVFKSRDSNMGIRQAGWIKGFTIRWSRARIRWIGENTNGDEIIDLSAMQGCITPDTILATDWEVAP